MHSVQNILHETIARVKLKAVDTAPEEHCKECKGGLPIVDDQRIVRCDIDDVIYCCPQYERVSKKYKRPEICRTSQIPPIYRQATLDFPSKVCEEIKQFCKGDKKLLVIAGGVGCGKTCGASAYLIEMGGGLFVDVSEIKTAVFRKDWEYLREIKEVKRLVIDDLGLEHPDTTGFFQSVIDEIINIRHGKGIYTVITTNLTHKEFVARYGERVKDRLKESGIFFSSKEESFRRR